MAAGRNAATSRTRGNGGGHGRPANNGHRSHNAGNGHQAAHQGRPSQNGQQAVTHRPPGRKPPQGSQTASEMLHSCSARVSRVVTPATAQMS